MFFATPIWLLGLLPWLGVALWLMWGRRRKTPVPFLELWRDASAGPPPKRSMQAPPPAVILALAAILLAILSAAGPAISGSGAAGGIPTVIVDRGATMSATAHGQTRYALAARRAMDSIRQTIGAGPMEFRAIPGGGAARIAGEDMATRAQLLSPTAVDTRLAVVAAVREALVSEALGGDGPVIVLTDQKFDLDDVRLTKVSPGVVLSSVGIIRFSIRPLPQPQAMVGLLNQSDLKTARLTIESGGKKAEMNVELPPRGQEKNVFVDLPALGATARAELTAADDLGAWHEAWLARQSSRPAVEARSPMPPEIAKIIAVYEANRPPDADAPRIAVVSTADDLPADPAVAVLVDTASAKAISKDQPLTVTPTPVSDGIDWPAALADAVAGAAPRGEWIPIVRVGDQTLVAIREEPIRQAWVGFHSDRWPVNHPQFAFFWDRLLDWVGGSDRGGGTFGEPAVGSLEGHWQAVEGAGVENEAGLMPGIYRDADGSVAAVNSPARLFDPAEDSDGVTKLSAYAASQRKRGTDLSPVGFLAAIACLAGAAVVWKIPKPKPQP